MRDIEAKNSRQFQYDFVRFVAMTWVISVHALSVVDTGRKLGVYYLVLCQSLFFTANALFFMLSGKFNLVQRNSNDWKGFYLKKTKSILLPVAVLYLLRTLYDFWPDYGSPLHFVKTYLLNCVGLFGSREYWFVFQLISMLLVTPFLEPLVRSLGESKKKAFLVIGLVWFGVSYACSCLGVMLGYSFLFGGFWFAYLIGPFIEERYSASGCRSWFFAVITVACCLATLLCVRAGFSSGAFDGSPFYVMTYLSVYGLLLSLGKRIASERARRVISWCAKHSFTVYMIHMMVLIPTLSTAPKLDGVPSLFEHVAVTLAVLLVCLFVAALLDTVVLRPLQGVFDILTRKLRK